MTDVGSRSGLLPSLPGRYYTGVEVFQRETERIFKRSWMCVGRSDSSPTSGQFQCVVVGEESVLIVRERIGRLRAFRNLCRHRGAQLCAEEFGRVGKSIRCMYHGWTYGLDGKLIAAANMHDMPDLVKEDYGLLPVRLEEWLGYLWINLDDDAATLAEQTHPEIKLRLGDLRSLDRYGIEHLRPARTITYDVLANWKVITENFMECYHCAPLHPQLIPILPGFASGYGTVAAYGLPGGADFAEGAAYCRSGRRVRPSLPGLLPMDDKLQAILLRPNVFLVLVPDHVAVFRLQPEAVDRTRLIVDWLFDREQMGRDDFDPEDSVSLLDLTTRQDIEVCERCQLGMRSDAYQGVLVPAENILVDFHQYVLTALGDGWPPDGALAGV